MFRPFWITPKFWDDCFTEMQQINKLQQETEDLRKRVEKLEEKEKEPVDNVE